MICHTLVDLYLKSWLVMCQYIPRLIRLPADHCLFGWLGLLSRQNELPFHMGSTWIVWSPAPGKSGQPSTTRLNSHRWQPSPGGTVAHWIPHIPVFGNSGKLLLLDQWQMVYRSLYPYAENIMHIHPPIILLWCLFCCHSRPVVKISWKSIHPFYRNVASVSPQ